MKSSRGGFGAVGAVLGAVVVVEGGSTLVALVDARGFGSRFADGDGGGVTVDVASVVSGAVLVVSLVVSLGGGGGGISDDRSFEGAVAAEMVVAALGVVLAFFVASLVELVRMNVTITPMPITAAAAPSQGSHAKAGFRGTRTVERSCCDRWRCGGSERGLFSRFR